MCVSTVDTFSVIDRLRMRSDSDSRVRWVHGLTENAGHETAGHENAGHEFAIHDKYRMKIYYITVQCAFLLNFKSCMYGECVNVKI